jgi:hypothetical protein
METQQIHFLLIVAVCAVVLIVLVWRAEKKAQRKARRPHKKATKKVYLQPHRLESGYRKAVLGHTASSHANGVGAWESRRRRANEETRAGSSFGARRLFSDAEKDDKDSDQDLAMTTIVYEPEDAPKTFRTRRKGT